MESTVHFPAENISHLFPLMVAFNRENKLTATFLDITIETFPANIAKLNAHLTKQTLSNPPIPLLNVVNNSEQLLVI
jgi:hypothetical protein